MTAGAAAAIEIVGTSLFGRVLAARAVAGKPGNGFGDRHHLAARFHCGVAQAMESAFDGAVVAFETGAAGADALAIGVDADLPVYSGDCRFSFNIGVEGIAFVGERLGARSFDE